MEGGGGRGEGGGGREYKHYNIVAYLKSHDDPVTIKLHTITLSRVLAVRWSHYGPPKLQLWSPYGHTMVPLWSPCGLTSLSSEGTSTAE